MRFFRIIFFTFISLLFLTNTTLVFAATETAEQAVPDSGYNCDKLKQEFEQFGGTAAQPLQENCYSAGGVVQKGIDIALYTSAVISVFFLIFGARNFMESAGNEEAAAAGRKTMTWAVLGLCVILLAWTFVHLVTNFFVGTPIK